MSKKFIVWALFDDGYSCWGNACNKLDNVICYCIGNGDFKHLGDKNIKVPLDLSLTNPNLIKELSKLPKPDVILASPPCESWSIADCGGRMIKDIGTEYLLVRNKDYYDSYNDTSYKNKKRDFLQKETSFINGINTVGATIKIIEYFIKKDIIDTQFWVIENPTTSMIWQYIDLHHCFGGIYNKTYYSTFDRHFSLKPTTFLSNINLHLKQDKKSGNKEHINKNSYDVRSKIPKKLCLDIINKTCCHRPNQLKAFHLREEIWKTWSQFHHYDVEYYEEYGEEYNAVICELKLDRLPKNIRAIIKKYKIDIDRQPSSKSSYSWKYNIPYEVFSRHEKKMIEKYGENVRYVN